jgi:cell division protein FtsQ
MPDNYYAPGEVFPGERAFSPRMEKTLKRVIAAAGVILAAELVWLFLVSPCMPLSRVELSGFQGLDRDYLLAQAGIDGKSSFMSVNPRLMEEALGRLPEIESARVEKRFPGSVSIAITGRKALAVSLVEARGRPALAVFDKEGVVFRIGASGDTEALSLPLVSGLFAGELRPGSRPDPLYLSFLLKLEAVRGSAPELLSAISEIRINRREFGGFDLILYPVHHPVRVLTGSDLDEYTLRYMLLMADVLIAREPRVGEIDFRAGMASYTVKEASSG